MLAVYWAPQHQETPPNHPVQISARAPNPSPLPITASEEMLCFSVFLLLALPQGSSTGPKEVGGDLLEWDVGWKALAGLDQVGRVKGMSYCLGHRCRDEKGGTDRGQLKSSVVCTSTNQRRIAHTGRLVYR